LLVNASREKQACEIRTRGGTSTQDPLYPEGHPKRIEEDSQHTAGDDVPSKKKKKKHKMIAKSSKTGKNPNSVFLFLMLKPKVVVLLIKKKLKRNQ
jgi:hypothetical protein